MALRDPGGDDTQQAIAALGQALGVTTTSSSQNTAVATVGSAPTVSSTPAPGQGIAFDVNGQLSTSVAKVVSGFEYAYSEFTAAVTVNTIAEAAAHVVVTAATITLAVQTTLLIEFYCPSLVLGAASSTFGVNLWDGTDKGRLFDGTVVSSPVANYPAYFSRRVVATPGSHSYSVRIWSAAAVNFLAIAGVGGAGTAMPGYIRVSRV
jgi:hypothetical protein